MATGSGSWAGGQVFDFSSPSRPKPKLPGAGRTRRADFTLKNETLFTLPQAFTSEMEKGDKISNVELAGTLLKHSLNYHYLHTGKPALRQDENT